MSDYWLMDAEGLVLGPVGLAVLRDIAAQVHLTARTRVSRDGKSWEPLAHLPELAEAILPPSPAIRQARERAEAERVQRLIERCRGLSAQELFGVPQGADEATYRHAFVTLAQPYSPGRLPPDALPELRAAYSEMFQFLTVRMSQVEQRQAHPRRAQAEPGAVGSATAVPFGDEAADITLRVQGERPQLAVCVTTRSVSVFTRHRLANLRTGALFVPTRSPLPLGTRLELVLRFTRPPPKELRARGTVICEDTVSSTLHDRGYGVRVDGLSKADRALLVQLVDSTSLERQAEVARLGRLG